MDTGDTQWTHPLDKLYCQKVVEFRRIYVNGDPKTVDAEKEIVQNKTVTATENVSFESPLTAGKKGSNSLEEKVVNKLNSVEEQNMELSPTKKLVS